HFSHGAEIKRLAPRELEAVEFKAEAFGMIQETLTEFAVAQNQTGAFFQRELRADDVVRERAGADEQFYVFRLRQLAKDLFGGVEIFDETPGAMGFRRLLEGAFHFGANRYRPG